MLIDQLEQQKNFTTTDKVLAEFTLEHIVEINNMTISELAKQTYTSKASIIRFCKKLGLAGYVEFQKVLLQESSETKRMTTLLNEEPINSKTTYNEVVTIVPSIYEKAISQTRLTLDKNQITRILNRLKHVTKLDIYGLGITNTIAQSAAFKFSTIGIEAEAHAGINEHYIIATRHKKNRIAILLSFTGTNSKLISIAKYLKRNGTYIIGIGERRQGVLYEYCDEYLEIYQKKLLLNMEMITAITATNYIIDILFISSLIDNYDDHTKNSIEVMKQKDQSLSDFDT